MLVHCLTVPLPLKQLSTDQLKELTVGSYEVHYRGALEKEIDKFTILRHENSGNVKDEERNCYQLNWNKVCTNTSMSLRLGQGIEMTNLN